jgi:hypothetical protein
MKQFFKHRLFLFLLSAGLFLACKKEEKVLLENENKTIKGTWYTKNADFKDVLNGTSNSTTKIVDFKPTQRADSYDDYSSQIIFKEDGTYQAVSHRNVLNFAIIGNYKNTDYRYGGLWSLFYDVSKIQFDKGVNEFNGIKPAVLNLKKLSSDSLILETSDKQQVHEWAIGLGRNTTREVRENQLVNQCSTGDTYFYGGKELAAFFATYKGYLEYTKDLPLDFNPYGLGVRKGAVQEFDTLYQSFVQVAPKADSCYQVNYNTYFNAGYNQAKAQYQNYQFRTQTITFYFSRFPNPNE